MILLINDANILIDLLKINLVERFFQLEYGFHVADLVIENELLEEDAFQLEMLISSGRLTKNRFTFDEMVEIQAMVDEHAGLSAPDCSCLFLARKLGAVLLTGDAALRRVAEQKGIEVHGILWGLDKLVAFGQLSKTEAADKLEELMNLNQRLPREECQKRLRAWRRTV